MRPMALALMGVCLLPACGADPAHTPEPGPASAEAPAPGAEGAPAEERAAPAEERAAEGSGKTSAPIEIKAEVGAGGAKIDLVFRAEASDVTVKVWGVDGLSVTSDATPIAGRTFRQGDRLELPVAFTAPATPSTLAVSASGQFGSRRLTRVQSFSVGGPPAPAQGPGEVRTDGAGRPVRVMKPQ